MDDHATDWPSRHASILAGLRCSKYVSDALAPTAGDLPGMPGVPATFRELQLLVFPGSDPHAWDIIWTGAKTETRYFVAYSCWHLHGDIESATQRYRAKFDTDSPPDRKEHLAILMENEPTIRVETCPIDKAIVDRLLQRFKSTKILAYTEASSIDPSHLFELCLGGIQVPAEVHSGVRYHWNTWIPRGWSALQSAVGELVKVFHAHIKTPTEQDDYPRPMPG